jgi:hypothetical protein
VNIDRLVRRTAIVVFLLCIAGIVMAGITSTEQPPQYLIRLADKTYEQNKAVPKTREECLARAKAIIPLASCVTIESFANAGTCADISKPVLQRELDADGFVVKPPIRGKEPASGNDWTTEIQDYVPAPYPACWVLGWREITQADLDDDVELANHDEPVPMTGDYLVKWLEPESEAARHHMYICYETDKEPCLTPPVFVSACGPYDSVACGGPG